MDIGTEQDDPIYVPDRITQPERETAPAPKVTPTPTPAPVKV